MKNKVILILGSEGGLGRSLISALIKEGNECLDIDINQSTNQNIEYLSFDLSSENVESISFF